MLRASTSGLEIGHHDESPWKSEQMDVPSLSLFVRNPNLHKLTFSFALTTVTSKDFLCARETTTQHTSTHHPTDT
eukprot:scaffold13167_cov58-Cyclotella_meneghiniana.AAC.7